MGGCQKNGPFLGTLNIRCRIIIGIKKGAIILKTTRMSSLLPMAKVLVQELALVVLLLPGPPKYVK